MRKTRSVVAVHLQPVRLVFIQQWLIPDFQKIGMKYRMLVQRSGAM